MSCGVNSEISRCSGPGLIGAFHTGRAPARSDFQYGVRRSISAGVQKARSARSLRGSPRGVGHRDGRQIRILSTAFLQIRGAEILHKDAEGPAIGNGMMNREYQNVIVGVPAEQLDPIKRALHHVERRVKDLARERFDRFGR